MVGMARSAVPARVVAGGTNLRATLAIEGIAPLHAARTSQRDVPTTLNMYSPEGGEGPRRPLLLNAPHPNPTRSSPGEGENCCRCVTRRPSPLLVIPRRAIGSWLDKGQLTLPLPSWTHVPKPSC